MTLTMPLRTPPPRIDLSELMKLAEPRRERLVIPLALALATHAALVLVPAEPATSLAEQQPVEIELPPEPAPEPAPPERPEPAPEPEPEQPPEPTPSTRPVAAAAPEAPQAASAGSVLTASAESENSDPAEPFDFTSDPNSNFGVGVVAVGGRARRGISGATAAGRGKLPTRQRSASPHNPQTADGLTKAANLSRVPRLGARNPCQGYFPPGALDDVATAVVRVVVGKSGSVSSATIVSESPRGQGFGSAARTCMLRQHFAPALDRAGRPAATAVAVNVRFSR